MRTLTFARSAVLASLVMALIAVLLLPSAVMAQSSKAPAIRFEKLAEGQTFRDNILEVKVKVSNFKLDSKAIGKANKAGTGHIAIRFNGEVVVRTAKTSVKLSGYEKGIHSISVELNNNDQTALSPAVAAKLSINLDLSGKIAKVSKEVIIIPASAKVAITIESQRADAIKFLTAYNKLGKDFEDATLNAGLQDPRTLQNPLALLAAFGKISEALGGMRQRLNGLQTSASVRETAEIKKASQAYLGKAIKVFGDFRTALQNNDAAGVNRAARQIEELEDDEDINRSDKLQEAILARFNIPDKEVGYERD